MNAWQNSSSSSWEQIYNSPQSLHWIATDVLQPYPHNPRIISPENIQRLVTSIQQDPRLLLARPLLVHYENGKYWVYGGVHRLQAARQLQIPKLLCFVETLSEEQLRQRIFKDNLHYAEWNWEQLEKEIQEMDRFLQELPSEVQEWKAYFWEENDALSEELWTLAPIPSVPASPPERPRKNPKPSRPARYSPLRKICFQWEADRYEEFRRMLVELQIRSQAPSLEEILYQIVQNAYQR